jgi:hypothetical protein
MMETVTFWQTDFGDIELSPWLAERVERMSKTRDGFSLDMRFKRARAFVRRMHRLSERRYLSEPA